MIQTVTRSHEICIAHRLPNHPGKCYNLHGHNIKVLFTITGEVDNIQGVIIDFGNIKKILVNWLEDKWDHKTLIYIDDRLRESLCSILPKDNVVITTWIPTSENMASYLLNEIGPVELPTNVTLTQVDLYETTKCKATVKLEDHSQ